MKRVYRWNQWFAMSRFILRQGKDYDCSPSTMDQQIRNQATSRGIRVSITQPNAITLVVTIKSRGGHNAKAWNRIKR